MSAENAVASLLVLEDGRYLMQLRDNRPDIYYPNHWGLFGGALEDGEVPLEALWRELLEEIDFRADKAEFFVRFDFNLSTLGQGRIFRILYQVPITSAEVTKLTLGEGRAFRAFDARELLCGEKVVPYDAFAIWLHASRHRFNASGAH